MRGAIRWSVPVVLWMAVTTAEAAEATLPPGLEAGITRAIEAELGETQAPGAAVAIVRDGQLVYLRAFGVRSLEERTPVTPDTLFRLGSTTKMMTALVALDAARKGLLSLDAPVSSYVDDVNPVLGGVTLRQLLSHTAGMREANPSVQSMDDDGLARMVRGWNAGYQFAPPGDIFSYSGPGYWLSGRALERVYGKSYAQVMREQFFLPLTMERSTLRPIEALTYDFSQGHEGATPLKIVRPMAENTAMYPAGSVFSSARELARFATVVLNGGRDGQRRVFHEEAVRDFFSAHVPLPGAEGAYSYGFGLVSFERKGTQIFEHGGVRRGYGSHIRFLPDRRGAIIVMTNRNGVTLTQSVEHITKTVFHLKAETPPQPEVPPLTAAEAPLYTGAYVHADLVQFNVSWTGEQLAVEFFGQTQPLRRTRDSVFQTPEGQEVVFVFKDGQQSAKYLHLDLLSAIRSSP